MHPKQMLGKMGESLAQKYLISLGYEIIDRNYYTRYGEIDIIAYQAHDYQRENKELVFIEVKTRRTKTFGFPEDSINTKKRSALISSSLAYLQNHPEVTEDWRIDVIAIIFVNDALEPEITHFINAVTNE